VLQEYLAEAVPGISIAAILDGSVVWSAGYGVRRAGGKEPVTADTVFEAASLGKPVLAYAILRLRDEGAIDLDRPLLEYMSYADVGADSRAKLVTARRVLSHRTGLPNWRSKGGPTFEFTPGERYGYSGEGFFWLQRVLEHITTIPFARYMREQVLQPCGMRRSSFVLLPDMIANCAISHPTRGQPSDGIYLDLGRRYLDLAQRWNKPVETWKYEDAVRAAHELNDDAPAIPSPNGVAPNAASSLLTTAGDYARFMTRSMPRSSRDRHDLSESTRREMLTPQSPLNRALSHGLGWFLEREAGTTSFWHSGFNRGFKDVALADAEGRIGVVFFTNSNEGDRLRWPIVHDFTGRGGAALL
jgi:CubicO group peptidase (beta-lactamase class C family)